MRIIAALAFAVLVALGILWLRGGHAPAPLSSQQAQWNYFRGPYAGVSPFNNAPISWDGHSGRGVIWKAPLPMAGVGSPVVWKGQVFVTCADNKERLVLALDAANGKELWRQSVPDGGDRAPLPAVSGSGLALPTPACDQNGVYALFGTGDLAAFSHDGKPLWQKFLGRPAIGYGFASSPCLGAGLLLVQFDTFENGRVLAIKTSNGERKWEHERLRGASWASPLVAPGPDGKLLFLLNASGSLTAFDTAGEVVWDVDGVTGEVAPSPAYWNGRVYAVNLGSFLLCRPLAGNSIAWRYAGSLSDASSPVATNGLVFMATANGQLVCLDGQNGQELWTRSNHRCYASLAASGGRIYSLGRDGVMEIVAAERAYKLIATCSLGEDTDATPAYDDGRIYMRGLKHLWCLGEK